MYIYTGSICLPSTFISGVKGSTHAVKVNCFLLSKRHYVVSLDFMAVVCQVVVFVWVFVP